MSKSEWEKCKCKELNTHLSSKKRPCAKLSTGHSVIDVAKRLGIGDGLLYTWVKKFKVANEPVAVDDMKSIQAELNRL